MKGFITACLLLACLSANAAELSRPTIWSTPKGYLVDVPLGVSQDQVFNALGVPSNTANLVGREMWTYEVGKGYGLKQFTYIFKAGTLQDVKYTDQGPYSGITASQVQAEAKNPTPDPYDEADL